MITPVEVSNTYFTTKPLKCDQCDNIATSATVLKRHITMKHKPEVLRDIKVATSSMQSSEKFCLKWNDFHKNISTSFLELKQYTEFTDVTLACDGNQRIEAHRVILSASNDFFRDLLKQTKHSHPLIYIIVMKAKDLVSVVDFVYYVEVNIYQDNLNDMS